MSAMHTPGPWVISRVALNFGRVITRADHVDRPYGAAVDAARCRATYMQSIASVSRHHCHLIGGIAEAEANARLIAAAPELLAALKLAVETIREWHGMHEPDDMASETWRLYQGSPEMKAINAAIAKAEGR